jgi:hypothetical protein
MPKKWSSLSFSTTTRIVPFASATTTTTTATTTTASFDGYFCGTVLAIPLICANHIGHTVARLHASIPIKKARGVAEDVFATIVRFDEAEALVVVPPQDFSNSFLACT